MSTNAIAQKKGATDLAEQLTRWLLPTTMIVVGIGLVLLATIIGPMVFGATQAFWYLSRASAFVALTLLWASMALGIGITNKLARIFPGAPTAFDLHQYTSLLGWAFVGFHVLILLGDSYMNYALWQLLVPFASTQYEQFWVGLGQIAFYLMIPVVLSFYARKRLGPRGWRTLHGLSYGFYALALLHGLFSGTDSGSVWTAALYWFTAVSLVGLTVYRIVVTKLQASKKTEKSATRLAATSGQ